VPLALWMEWKVAANSHKIIVPNETILKLTVEMFAQFYAFGILIGNALNQQIPFDSMDILIVLILLIHVYE
jgi:hypothetical protein